jgi:hypothetical protein
MINSVKGPYSPGCLIYIHTAPQNKITFIELGENSIKFPTKLEGPIRGKVTIVTNLSAML